MLKTIFLLFLLIFLVTACGSAVVVRDYKFAPIDHCDCYVRKPLIPAGFKSIRKEKSTAVCNRYNFTLVEAQIDSLSREQDSINELNPAEEQLPLMNLKITGSEFLYDSLTKLWTSCKIRTTIKHRSTGPGSSELVKFKRKITYYNSHNSVVKKNRNRKIQW